MRGGPSEVAASAGVLMQNIRSNVPEEGDDTSPLNLQRKRGRFCIKARNEPRL